MRSCNLIFTTAQLIGSNYMFTCHLYRRNHLKAVFFLLVTLRFPIIRHATRNKCPSESGHVRSVRNSGAAGRRRESRRRRNPPPTAKWKGPSTYGTHRTSVKLRCRRTGLEARSKIFHWSASSRSLSVEDILKTRGIFVK